MTGKNIFPTVWRYGRLPEAIRDNVSEKRYGDGRCDVMDDTSALDRRGTEGKDEMTRYGTRDARTRPVGSWIDNLKRYRGNAYPRFP